MNFTENFRSALLPYTKQRNTGNVYEIATALELLRKMGMPNSILDEQSDLINAILVKNYKDREKISTLFVDIRKQPIGTGLVFDGIKVNGIVSVTQEDNMGGTGDLILHTTSGVISMSVCGGTVKRNGTIEKCLTNPTCTRFKCTNEDVDTFAKIGLSAIPEYKEYMSKKYGSAESNWPTSLRGKPNPIAIRPCSEIAKLVVGRFNSLSIVDKKAVFEDIMRIKGTDKPADYIAVVNPKTKIIKYFEFGDVLVKRDAFMSLEASGIFIVFKLGDNIVGKTQVKYNDGIYRKGRTSSITSSWNATFILTELFKMKSVQAVS
jgi:hypothetical protein